MPNVNCDGNTMFIKKVYLGNSIHRNCKGQM